MADRWSVVALCIFTKIMKTRFFPLTLVVLTLLAIPARAAIVYENATTFEGLFNDSKLESGDQLNLAGSQRLITDFSFEYFGDFAITGDEKARVRFYEMNGAPGDNPFATPGTLLYESASFNINSGYGTVSITNLAVFLPANTFTFSVEFTGIAATESVGLLYYDPPTVGSSDAYFWEKENGVWSAVATDDAGNNFAAQVKAELALYISQVQTVPTGAAVTLSNTTPGRTYTLEYKTSVTQVGWERGASAVATGSSVTLIDTTAGNATFRLYRVEEI
jgi:hypothetical protein